MIRPTVRGVSHAAKCLTLAALATAVACGREGSRQRSAGPDSAAAAGSPRPDTGTGAMAGMPGMGGTAGAAGGMGAEMEAHMRMMQGASADSLRAMLPMHRQMVANMLSRMNGEMRQMNMPADVPWTATVDSLRQDLVRMPEMSGAELKEMMPGHVARVSRLADMHQRMMASMNQRGGAPRSR